MATFSFTKGATLDLTGAAATTYAEYDSMEGSSSNDLVTGGVSGSTVFSSIDFAAGNDTYIWKGQEVSTIDGGDGIDTLNINVEGTTVDLASGDVFSSFEVVNGSTGADVVTGAGTSTNYSVSLAAGDDSFATETTATYKSVDGGAGTDTLTFTTAITDSVVNLSTTTVYKNFETLVGSAEDDSVTTGTKFSSVDLKAGDDTFNWDNTKTFTLMDGGEGTDTFKVTGTKGATLNLATANYQNFEALQATTNADVVTGSTDGTSFASVSLDAGADTFVWKGETNYTLIDGGAASDTFTFAQASTLDLAGATEDGIIANFETFKGSSKADVVTASGSEFTTLELAGGNDTFVWMGETGATVDAGSNADTLIFGQAATLDMTATTGAGSKFTNFESLVGSEEDDVVVLASTQYFTNGIALNAGDDTLTWVNTATKMAIDGGEGEDTFKFTVATTLDLVKNATKYTNFEILEGSGSADIVTGVTDGTQFATVNLGGGIDTFVWKGETNYVSIDGGAASDVFKFAQASTLDLTAVDEAGTITNFETIQGSTLADEVTGTISGVTAINLDKGDDTYVWNGDVITVDAGDGTDTLVFGEGVTELSSDLTDSNFEKLKGSAEDDTVTVATGGFAKGIDLQAGDDSLTWAYGAATTITGAYDGGEGTDTLTVTGAAGALDLSKAFAGKLVNFEVLETSGGVDVVTGATDGTQFATINLGAGADTFVWKGETNYVAIDGGDGADVFNFAQASTLDLGAFDGIVTGFETLNGSAKDDVVTGTASEVDFAAVNLGTGNDTFVWVGETTYTIAGGGQKNDTFVIGAEATLDIVAGDLAGRVSGFTKLVGSESADAVVVDDSVFTTSIDLKAGDDTLTWEYTATPSYSLVDGGDGADTLVISSGSPTNLDLTDSRLTKTVKNFETLEGSSSDDIVIGKTDGVQFATIDLKEGADTFVWTGDTGYALVDGGYVEGETNVLKLKNASTLDLSTLGDVFVNFEKLTASDKNDVITGATDGTQFTSVDLAAGNDTFVWMGETGYTSVAGGAGTDTFVLGAAGTFDLTADDAITLATFEKLVGSADSDVVIGADSTAFAQGVDLKAGDDTLTWGVASAAATAVTDGGEGNDTLIISGSSADVDLTGAYASKFVNFETLIGSENADQVTGKTNGTQFATVELKEGDDTFTWNGETTYTLVDGGEDEDTFAFKAAATLDMGAMADVFQNFEILKGSAGKDIVTGAEEAGTITTIDLGAEADTFTWMGATYEEVKGGAGTDVLVLGNTDAVNFVDGDEATIFSQFETLKGNAEGDTVTVKTTSFTSITLGTGDDSLTVTDLDGTLVADGGAGVDTLSATDTALSLDLKDATVAANIKNFEILVGSSEADTVTGATNGTQFATIKLAAGEDNFVWDGTTKYTLVDGGDDDDTLTLSVAATAKTSAYATNFQNFEILVGSASADVITGITSENFATVKLGNGADTFTWGGDTAFTLVDGETGNDVLVLGADAADLLNATNGTIFANFESLQGSSGDDTVVLAADSANFTSGIDLKAGNDTFTWNGSSITGAIDGGKGTDSFILGTAVAGTIDLTSTNYKNFETFTGTDEADIVEGNTNGTAFATISLGAGDDTFVWGGSTKYQAVDAGDGDADIIKLSEDAITWDTKTSAYLTKFTNFEILVGSDNDDVITKVADSMKTIDLADGDDTFTITSTDFTDVNGGDGTDTLVLGTTGMTIDLAGSAVFSNFEVIKGSTGDDTITINDTVTTVNLGSGGNDTLNIDSTDGWGNVIVTGAKYTSSSEIELEMASVVLDTDGTKFTFTGGVGELTYVEGGDVTITLKDTVGGTTIGIIVLDDADAAAWGNSFNIKGTDATLYYWDATENKLKAR